MFHRRLALLAGGFSIILLLWAGQLASLTVVHSERYRGRAEAVLVSHDLVPTKRGDIFDRHRRPLAQDRVSQDLLVSFALISGRWSYQQAVRHAVRTHRDQWPELNRAQREELVDEYLPIYNRHLNELWAELTRITGRSPAELDRRKNDVRRRVAVIRGSVLVRMLERRAEELDEPVSTAAASTPIREEIDHHPLVEDLDPEMLRLVQFRIALAQQSDRPEDTIWRLVSVQTTTRREYPPTAAVIEVDTSTFPSTLRRAAPLQIEVDGTETLMVGTMRPVWREDVERRPFRRVTGRPEEPTGRRTEIDLGGYLPGDTIGRMGLELSMESVLRGLRGRRTTYLETMEQIRTEPVPGQDIHLTIDLGLQQRIAAVMDPRAGLMRSQPWHQRRDFHDPRFGESPDPEWIQLGDPLQGGAIVMEVETGEILAAVSIPSVPRRQMADNPDSVWSDFLTRPFVNRVTGLNWRPGSTVKPIILAAAMADGHYQVGQTITCTGYLDPANPGVMRCWIYRQFNQTHGPLAAPEAMARSCNIFFYVLGREMGGLRVAWWYDQFGLGRRMQSGLADLPGILPNVHQPITPGMPGFTQGDAIFMAIGQGPVEWTLLQGANAYAVLARGGIFTYPTVIRDREAVGLPIVRRDLSLPPEAVEQVLQGLDESSNQPYGTTYRLSLLNGERIFNVPGVRVMAKSGTAQAVPLRWDSDGDGQITTRDQILRRGNHAWTIALVQPSGDERPKYVIAVAVEFAGSGGAVAGPIVNQIIHALRHEGYL